MIVLAKRLKRIAWRITGAYIWLRFLALILFQNHRIYKLELHFASEFVSACQQHGFAPASSHTLLFILKAAWLCLICEMSPLQLLILMFYSIFFPILMWLGKKFSGGPSTVELRQKFALMGRQIESLKFSTYGFVVLIAWVVLYGNTHERGPWLVGSFLVGVQLLLQGHDAIVYTMPLEARKLRYFSKRLFYVLLPINIHRQWTPKPQSGKWMFLEKFMMKLHRIAIPLIARYALYKRGLNGRRRAALAALMLIVVRFAVLGILFILFWALIIAGMQAPSGITLSGAIFASAAHVLPGIQIDHLAVIAPWLQIWIASTTWLLLVLYASVAASFIPLIQGSAIDTAGKQYKALKQLFLKERQFVRSQVSTTDS